MMSHLVEHPITDRFRIKDAMENGRGGSLECLLAVPFA